MAIPFSKATFPHLLMELNIVNGMFSVFGSLLSFQEGLMEVVFIQETKMKGGIAPQGQLVDEAVKKKPNPMELAMGERFIDLNQHR
jgi:hypothetical protein